MSAAVWCGACGRVDNWSTSQEQCLCMQVLLFMCGTCTQARGHACAGLGLASMACTCYFFFHGESFTQWFTLSLQAASCCVCLCLLPVLVGRFPFVCRFFSTFSTEHPAGSTKLAPAVGVFGTESFLRLIDCEPKAHGCRRVRLAGRVSNLFGAGRLSPVLVRPCWASLGWFS